MDFPDFQTLYLWLLSNIGVPVIILIALRTLLSILSYVTCARTISGWLRSANQTIRARFARTVGVRAFTVVTGIVSGIAIPLSVVALVKLGAIAYGYIVLHPGDTTLLASVVYSLTTDTRANATLLQVGLWTAGLELLFAFATLAKIEIAHMLLYLIGALMLGAMWLTRILFGVEAIAYVALTYFHVEGASLDVAGFCAVIFVVAVVGHWAIGTFAETVGE